LLLFTPPLDDQPDALALADEELDAPMFADGALWQSCLEVLVLALTDEGDPASTLVIILTALHCSLADSPSFLTLMLLLFVFVFSSSSE
jgi:hypothetical protein